MSELISEELFAQFRTSRWPELFSEMAQSARAEGVAVDQQRSFAMHECGLVIILKDERQMLERMGLVEDRLFRRGFITPSMVQDGFCGDPNSYTPHFSSFGKQIIMACENLFTAEEHAAANTEAAQTELDSLLTEAQVRLGR